MSESATRERTRERVPNRNLLALALCFSVASTSRNLPTFDEIKRDGISAIKFEQARIHFLNDDFVAVAVVV